MNGPKICLIMLIFLTIVSSSSCSKSSSQTPSPTQIPSPTPPNIVFLFADDLGWGDLSCYGNGKITTSALDQLAKEGTLFTDFYVAGPACSPSRAAIMTGQFPARNRIFGAISDSERNAERGMPNSLDSSLIMLTDILKSVGYVTGHFGKWHLGHVSPEDYGLDVFRTTFISNTSNSDPIDISSPEARPSCTRQILDEALTFIEVNRDQLFFTNIWLSDVHATLNPSLEQLEYTNHLQSSKVDFYGAAQVYYAALLEMDRQIGRFVDALDQLGLRDSTLIIFSSDNGPEDYQIREAAHSGVGSTGPFRGRKRSIYEGGIRVPFILRWPGNVPADKVNYTSVVNGVDFLPTLSKLAGAEVPNGLLLDGEDMSDVWLGSDRQRQRACFWEWRDRLWGHLYNHPPRLAVRDGDFKLLMNPDESRVELYDLYQDPGERDNIANEYPELVQSLKELLLNWNAELPTSPVHPEAGTAIYPWPGL